MVCIKDAYHFGHNVKMLRLLCTGHQCLMPRYFTIDAIHEVLDIPQKILTLDGTGRMPDKT